MEALPPPRISFIDGVFVVTLGPEYSHLQQNMLDNLSLLTMLADSVDPPRIAIDMGPVQFAGSAMIGRLVAISERISKRADGALGLFNLSKFLKVALSISNIDAVLKTFETQEAAITALGNRQ